MMREGKTGVDRETMRVGIGYDIHRTAAGRRLVLGGIELESEFGLDGHSDADVVLHAVSDALLGASALGDIGDHFPDTAPEWKDADSSVMLARVLALVRDNGFCISNIDINIIAQKPRLGETKAVIRDNIAALLGLDPTHVSMKAKTKEGLGPVGAGEAIEALACVLLEKSQNAEHNPQNAASA